MVEDIKLDYKLSIGKTHPTFIIAEIGQNHQGDLTKAMKLIQAAKDSGADCVKFQKSNLQKKFTKHALEQPYASPNSFGATYGQHKEYLEFNEDEYRELKAFAERLGLVFSASAMDTNSLEFLVDLNLRFIKIGSGDANNSLLIKQAAEANIPLIISTGMQSLDTVRNIYETVSEYHKHFVLLHCVSSYPAPLEDINLEVINLYKREFPDIHIGYSGHELGIHVCLAAVAMGAKVIERHFTLDKNQKGSDHKCSLEPKEFLSLVNGIRNIETALGKPMKFMQISERPCFEKLGKSIVAAKDLKKGCILELSDMDIKVCGMKGFFNGTKINLLVGKTLRKDVDQDEPITENDLE